jgi:hypothetical protein
MNAPTLWIIAPIFFGALLLFITNQRVLSVLGGSAALTLALAAQLIPIELALKLGPLSVKIDSSLTVLGRVLTIQASEGPLLALIYGAAALWFFGAEASKTAPRLVPLGFMIIALMVASIAVEPFLCRHRNGDPAVHPMLTASMPGCVRCFLIYQTLAMPLFCWQADWWWKQSR